MEILFKTFALKTLAEGSIPSCIRTHSDMTELAAALGPSPPGDVPVRDKSKGGNIKRDESRARVWGGGLPYKNDGGACRTY